MEYFIEVSKFIVVVVLGLVFGGGLELVMVYYEILCNVYSVFVYIK